MHVVQILKGSGRTEAGKIFEEIIVKIFPLLYGNYNLTEPRNSMN
jgi:hypothetical protein